MLNTSEKIRKLCKDENLTITELADRIGTTRQNFSNKLSRNNFPESELQAIAKALDCQFESFFIKKDGSKL